MTKTINNHPIGVFDSGLGGLTVWKEIVSLLPDESTIYIGDSINTPYGAKSQDEIYLLSKKLIEFLLVKQVKLIVIACNTITVSCIEKLREEYPHLPIVGTVPTIKTAVEVTKNKKIGILATTRTANSQYHKELLDKFAKDTKVVVVGTDELVPLIERGESGSLEMKKLLQKVLEKFKQEGVDTVVLGSTHFPFLREMIQDIMGNDVQLLDSGGAVARQVKRILEHNEIAAAEKNPQHTFYTTGDPVIAKKLLATTITEDREFEKISLGGHEL